MQSLEGQTISVLVPEDVGLRYRYYGNEDIRVQAIMQDFKPSEYQQRLETEVDIR